MRPVGRIVRTLSNTDRAYLSGQEIRMRLLLRLGVLVRGPKLWLCFTCRRSTAKPPILDPRDHVHGVKVGLQIMKLTVVLKLKLLDELVEFTVSKLDLPRKEIGTLMQVVTDVAHGLPPLSLDRLK